VCEEREVGSLKIPRAFGFGQSEADKKIDVFGGANQKIDNL
jgi:hypothetical protein